MNLKNNTKKRISLQPSSSILIIEDNMHMAELVEHYLVLEGYVVYKAFDGRSGLELFYKKKPDLVISDVIMPYMNGYQLCAEIKSHNENRLVPVVLLTSLNDNDSKILGIEAGADDFLIKPVNRYLLLSRIKSLLKNKKLNEKLDNSWSMLFSLVKVIEAKDPYTEKHGIRVAQLSYTLGKELQLSEELSDVLAQGGVLHDIGKVGIPDSILGKNGALSDEEFDTMKTHTTIGYNICKDLRSLKDIADIIYSHHENYDGSGYPQGLRKDEIPLCAQIVALADVYDALRSDRSYRKKLSFDQTIDIIRQGKGKRFDPELTDIFIHKVAALFEKLYVSS